MHCLARIRQPQREEIDPGRHPGQHDVHVPEVDFRFRPRQMRLRHEHRLWPHPCLPADLLATLLHIDADHGIRDVIRLVSLDQPVEDPLSGVPLFGRRIQVGPQHPVDQGLVRIKPGLLAPLSLARLRPLPIQRPPNRPPCHVVPALQSPQRHTQPVILTDRGVQIDLRLRVPHEAPSGMSTPHRPTASPQLTSKQTDIANSVRW